MTRPSFSYGIVIALVLALVAGALFAIIAPPFGSVPALRLLVPALALAYLVCLRFRGTATTGRIAALAFWFMVTAIVWLLALPIGPYVLVHAGMLWLLRSLCFHSGPTAALLDLGLTALGACAASWALSRSGSVFLAAWCFFLVQAAFVAIPPRSQPTARETGEEAFESARRRADAALARLFTH